MKKLNQFLSCLMLLSVCFSYSQVGVGTVNPTETIDVDGSARVRDLDEGYVVSDTNGVLSISENSKSTSGHMQWDNVLVGRKSALMLFTGRVASNATDISFMIHYDVDDKYFAVMSEANCTVTDLGATAGDDGRLRIQVSSLVYDLTFNSADGFCDIAATQFWVQGTFFTIANIK